MKKIELLDCTLRDGGNALEDDIKFYDDNRKFSFGNIQDLINKISLSGVELIELGVVEKNNTLGKGCSYYESMEEISDMIPEKRALSQLYLAGYNIHPEWLDDIPEYRSGLCEGVRVYLRYSELKKSLEFGYSLSQKGYKVFLQNALTLRYTKEDLKMVIEYANKMKAYAVYIVDTNGYMEPNNILELVNYFDDNLDKSIKIGFHPHDHMCMAYSNARYFLERDLLHDVIIDSCILGMGRGAGNLQTELIVPYLIEKYDKEYKLGYVLDACEIVEKLRIRNIWGYSVLNMLAAIYHTTSKYSIELRKEYNCSYRQINDILMNMKEEYKYRYTKSNIQKMYEEYKTKRGRVDENC